MPQDFQDAWKDAPDGGAGVHGGSNALEGPGSRSNLWAPTSQPLDQSKSSENNFRICGVFSNDLDELMV